MFDAAVLDPVVDFLRPSPAGEARSSSPSARADRAAAGGARGVPVHGIELSPHMVDQLRAKPGTADVDVTIGDMTTTRIAGSFAVVYLVFNTITNVTTQAEQVAVFHNAAAHLEPGGCFVVEVEVPQLRRLPVANSAGCSRSIPTTSASRRSTTSGQVSWSHHWMTVDGRLVRHSAPYRYVWPSELDLMAQLAGLRLRERWATWSRAPFTSESPSQVAVFEKPLS